MHNAKDVLLHTFPAFMMDVLLRIRGAKPMYVILIGFKFLEWKLIKYSLNNNYIQQILLISTLNLKYGSRDILLFILKL